MDYDLAELFPYIIAVLCLITIFLVISYLRQKKRDSLKREIGDDPIFKGIQYILSNKTDRAIEEFSKAVHIDSNTIEIYIALADLYRSKGEIERAIRIRQNIILRPNLPEKIKNRALFDLAMDYRKGGFLNRALDCLLEVTQRIPSDLKAWKELERLYQDMKDWKRAHEIRKKIASMEKDGKHNNILAHYLCEMGKERMKEGELGKAKSYFKKAISTHRECVDAYLQLGNFYIQNGNIKKALGYWKNAIGFRPDLMPIIFESLEELYSRGDALDIIGEFLRKCKEENPSSYISFALARHLLKEGDTEEALKELKNSLEMNPKLWEAWRLQGEILLQSQKGDRVLDAYKALLENLKTPSFRYQCTECGFESQKMLWQCPKCRSWDSLYIKEAG